ncbi:hypothetical protein F2P56_010775 [Juglans regia]|uniref:Uncharacterized protein LOC108996225 n=2 Tax=Juglans regia TaxID=51240 RepID=A0A2I4F7B4_JUGRE|nr:uncharacterized protein LOC108996225 [Juglans regia]KAF5470250.1 hypothetical protein F2P56_010775 [Juglans regia]
METNTFSLELLTNDNYADWSVKMKNNLLAQGLWDIVETCSKPPKPDDDVVEFKTWKKMNAAALHAIQSSCGMDILSRISKISSAKIAWETLAEMFMEMRLVLYNTVEQGHSCSSDTLDSGQDMPTGTGANQKVESGNSSSAHKSGNMETNILSLELSLGTGANQRHESGNSSDNQDRSNSSNILDNGQNTIIQIEDDNSIIDKGNFSSSNSPGPEMEDDYAALLKAVQSGNWNATRELLMKDHPAALTARIMNTGGTVLHAAVNAEQEHIVEELVNMISENDLEMQNELGFTALHSTTIIGNRRMAECLIIKNKRLVSIRDYRKELPVSLAMAFDHRELARYLYSQTPLEDLEAEEGCHGASLLNRCIYYGDLDMALKLMKRCPSLAFAKDHQSPHVYPLEVLAYNSTDAFELSGNYGMVFWKQWIYNHCIHDISEADLDRAADQEKNIESVLRADLWRKLVSRLLNLLGFKRLYETKLVRAQFRRLLILMCQESQRNRYDLKIIMKAVVGAIKRGNFEFVCHIVKANPEILWRGMFHWVVLHRQHRIFSLIYSLKQKNVVLNLIDESDNIILHMAGKVIENTAIDHIRGAALQMQREVQWFQEVERICPPSYKETLNKDGLTPEQLFTKDHQEMRKEGERWMKDTATSCTVVGALIITIMFAAAFTIPGGNNQDTGMPILVHDKLFTLFIVADSLSLFSSTTSVLMFLGILTSHYAEKDFLRSLPRKMIIGLFALFFSIASMMIAFSTALLLMLRGKYQIVIPIIGLASIPVILFVVMQSRLLVEMFNSTYRLGIFDRKMKSLF